MRIRLFGRAALSYVLLLWIRLATAQECGSLMTYRQFSVHVAKAPACYRNGCGATPISSMTSECLQRAPCRALWELMHNDQRTDYCAACGDDIACRIPGWPIMNSTEVCNTTPENWIFNASGECCTASGDAVPIIQWVSSMCNGSEWRQPFEYYGGMAQQDWAEWIEPWNWTFTKQDSTAPVPCAARSTALSLVWVENLFEFVTILIILAGFIFFVQFGNVNWNSIRLGRQPFDPLSKANVAQVGGGLTNGIFWILSGVFGAIAQHYTPGYASLPIGDFFILYCTRPSLNGVNFALFYLIRRFLKAETPQKEARARARAANLLIGFGYSEWIQQVFGLPILGIVAAVGTKKGFYRPGALSPYWQGSPALVMYVGALLGIIFSVFALIAVTYFLLEYEGTRRVHRMLQTSDQVRVQFEKELGEREWQLSEDIVRFREDLERGRRAHELRVKQEALNNAIRTEDVRSRRATEQSEQRLAVLDDRQARLNEERHLFDIRSQELIAEQENSERDFLSRRDKLNADFGALGVISALGTAGASQRRTEIQTELETLDKESQNAKRRFREEVSHMEIRGSSIQARQEELTRDREEDVFQSRQESLDTLYRQNQLRIMKDEIDLERRYHTLLTESEVLEREKREMRHEPSQDAAIHQNDEERIRRKQIFLNQQRRHHDTYSKRVDLEAVRRSSERSTMQEQLARDRRIWELRMKQKGIDAERAELASESSLAAREQAANRLNVRQEVLESERQEHEGLSAEEIASKDARDAELRAKQEALDNARQASDQLQQAERESRQDLGDVEGVAPIQSETQRDGEGHSRRRTIQRNPRMLLFASSPTQILAIVRQELDSMQKQLEENEQVGWRNRMPRPIPRPTFWSSLTDLGGLPRQRYRKQVRSYIIHEKKRVACVLLGQVEFEVEETEREKAERRLTHLIRPYDERLLQLIRNPTVENYREKLAWLPFTFWLLTYIWRWMFWYGFIYSMGDRWCPPPDYLDKMPGLFGAFMSTAVGLLSNSLISTASYASPLTGAGTA